MTLAASALLAAAETIGPTARLLALLAVVGVGVSVFLIVNLLTTSQAVERDLETRLSPYTGGTKEEGWMARLRVLRRFVVEAERLAERRGVLGQIETALEQANIAVRPGEAIGIGLVLALLVGVVGLIATGNLLIAVIFGVVAAAIAAAAVAVVAAQQRRRFEEQLPDTLNLLATSLRAGYSMQQALEAVSSEAPEPTAREFKRILNEIRLGRSVSEALQDSANRMESTDFDWVVLAFTIQREVGGNLAEVLQTTSETILQRGRLRREARALTAEGRISALVLASMPFLMFGLLYTSNRNYLDPMFETRVGIIALVGAFLLLGIGVFWLFRIIRVEV
jgi:tight adherence protein B